MKGGEILHDPPGLVPTGLKNSLQVDQGQGRVIFIRRIEKQVRQVQIAMNPSTCMESPDQTCGKLKNPLLKVLNLVPIVHPFLKGSP